MDQGIITVLLIEDQEPDARLLQELLADARGVSFEVIWADTLDAGFGHLSSQEIDVILLDLTLQHSWGFATFAAMYAEAPAVPIVVLTNTDDEALALRTVREGAQDYLFKWETNTDVLVRVIRYAIERKRTEGLLRAQRQLLARTLRSLPDGVLLLDDPDFKIRDCNPAAVAIFGWSRDELVGQTTAMLHVDQEMRRSVHRRLEATLADQGTAVCHVELQMVRKDGSVFPAELRITPLLDEQGQDSGWVSVIRDISARRQALDALQRSETRFRTLVQSMNDSVFTLDREQRHTGVFGRWQGQYGMEAEAFLGKTAREVMGANRAGIHEWANERALAGEDVVYEWSTPDKDGMARYFQTSLAPLRDAQDKIVGLVGVGREVTESKRMEAALRRRNRQLELIQRTGRAFVSSLDLEKVIATVLEEVRSILGAVASSIWLLDEETGELVCQEATGPQGEIVRGWRLAPGEGIAGWVAREGRSLVVSDAPADARHTRAVDAETGLQMRSLMTVPLRVRRGIIGVVQLVDTTAGRFDDEDLALLEPLALSAAVAVENARLYEQAQAEIVERRRMEEALRREKDLVARMMETSPVGIMMVDTDECITFANAHAEQILGLSKSQDAAHTYEDSTWQVTALDGRELPSGDRVFRRVLDTRKPLYDQRRAIVYPSGRQVLLSVNAAPLLREDGELDGIVATVEDITEAMRAEQALQGALDVARQRRREVAALLEGAQAVLRNRDFETTARTLFDLCKRLIGATAGYVALLSEDEQENDVLFLDPGDVVCKVDPDLPMPVRGLREDAYRTGRTVYENDFAQNEGYAFLPEGHARLNNVLFTPLKFEEQAVGLLGLANKPEPFTKNDARIAAAFGELAAIALFNRRTLRSLERSEERFRTVANFAYAWEYWVAPDGSYIYVSPSSERITGYAPEEFMDRPDLLLSIVHPEDRARIARHMDELGGVDVTRLDFRIIDREGTTRWIQHTCRPVYSESGARLGRRASNRDVTEHKAAQDALLASEKRFRFLAENAQDIIYILRLRPTRAFEYMSPAATTLTGYPPEAYYADPDLILRIVSAEDRALIANVFQGQLASGATFVIRCAHKDGQSVWLEQRTTPIFDETGALVAIEGVARDVTERVQMEQMLKHQNEALTVLNIVATMIGQSLDLVDTLQDMLDLLLELMSIDGAWIEVLDDARTLISEPIIVQWRSDAPFLLIDLLEGHGGPQAWDEVGWAVCVPLRSRERVWGCLCVLNYQVEALDVQDEQLLAAIGHQMGVAIENAQLAQEATEVEILREVDHFRSELIANVSHELRTPLGLISIFCTSLLMDDVTFDRDTQLEFLQGIEKQAGKLEGIVENLLDMERMESERLCLDKRPTDLAQIAHDLSRSFAEQYPNHTLTYHFSTEPFVVSVDPKRIEQVLRNLLSNALKYSPEGGEIRVEGRRDARQAVLQVSDSGIGIPAEEQARIFERFYRVDNELTRRVGGVGLGLAVCQGIVEAHGGRIWVESALGEGTTVYFSLPVDPHPDEDILV